MAPKRSFAYGQGGGGGSGGVTAPIIDTLDALPSRPLRFVLLLLLANFAGHYFPLLWSDTDRGALLAGGWGARGFSAKGSASGEGVGGNLETVRGRGNRTALQIGSVGSDAIRGSGASRLQGVGRAGGANQEDEGLGATEWERRGARSDERGGMDRGSEGAGAGAGAGAGEGEGEGAVGLTPESPRHVRPTHSRALIAAHISKSPIARLLSLVSLPSHLFSPPTIPTASAFSLRNPCPFPTLPHFPFPHVPPSPYLPSPHLPSTPLPSASPPLHRPLAPSPPSPRSLLLPRQSISAVADLRGGQRRVLLFMPRHGLGNSLRGYVSAFVYARLSGRRLVRLHAAEHAKVYDTLCAAFTCGFDAMRWSNESGPWGGTMGVYRQLELLQPVQLQSAFKTSGKIKSSLGFTGPIMLSKSPSHFDGFWQLYPRVQACVFSAFRCSSLWCVHSRAIHELILGPSRLLQEVVGQVLLQHMGEGTPPVPSQKGVADGDMFDVALHIRTRPAAIEQIRGHGDEELSRVGCEDAEEEEEETGAGSKGKKGKSHEFLKGCLWDCIASLLEKLQQDKAARSMARDAAASTDMERQRMPTMAEFFLMAKAHTLIEAGSYMSTFAYFAGLLGNATLASIDWEGGSRRGRAGGVVCGLKVFHEGEAVEEYVGGGWAGQQGGAGAWER
ncbi:unnamed protein product [Closterium sp. Naga37s-1]|nr:unnamed protein product [Closterium sp. Naga37s-1]